MRYGAVSNVPRVGRGGRGGGGEGGEEVTTRGIRLTSLLEVSIKYRKLAFKDKYGRGTSKLTSWSGAHF